MSILLFVHNGAEIMLDKLINKTEISVGGYLVNYIHEQNQIYIQ